MSDVGCIAAAYIIFGLVRLGRNEDGLEVGQSSLDDHFLDVFVLHLKAKEILGKPYFHFVFK